jgi:hypothetical protein
LKVFVKVVDFEKVAYEEECSRDPSLPPTPCATKAESFRDDRGKSKNVIPILSLSKERNLSAFLIQLTKSKLKLRDTKSFILEF